MVFLARLESVLSDGQAALSSYTRHDDCSLNVMFGGFSRKGMRSTKKNMRSTWGLGLGRLLRLRPKELQDAVGWRRAGLHSVRGEGLWGRVWGFGGVGLRHAVQHWHPLLFQSHGHDSYAQAFPSGLTDPIQSFHCSLLRSLPKPCASYGVAACLSSFGCGMLMVMQDLWTQQDCALGMFQTSFGFEAQASGEATCFRTSAEATCFIILVQSFGRSQAPKLLVSELRSFKQSY